MTRESKAVRLPEELQQAFSQRDLIVCVGPGPSTRAGLPDSRALARALVGLASADDPSLDVDELGTRIDAGRVPEALQVAQRSLGDRFEREVRTRLSDDALEPPPLLRALASLQPKLRAVYSVTLDRLVERALDGRWPSFDAPRPDLAQRRHLVFKVLGSLANHDSWVLTQAQVQRELSPGADRHDAFAASYRAHQMLFVGFDVDDPELESLLDMTPATTEGHGPGHFIALPRCSMTDRQLLEGRGLQVIVGAPKELLDALAATLGSATLIGTTSSTPQPTQTPRTQIPPTNRTRWMAMAGALVLGGGIATAVMLQGDDPPAQTKNAARELAPPPASEPPAPVDESTGSGTPSASDANSSGGAPPSTSDAPAASESGSTTDGPTTQEPKQPRSPPKVTCYAMEGQRAHTKTKPPGKTCPKGSKSSRRPPKGCDRLIICF